MSAPTDAPARTELAARAADPALGLYFIGTTPPKASTSEAKVAGIADKLLARLQDLHPDGVVVYDIQDESSRIDKPRPFPFKSTHDPLVYGQLLRERSGRPVIVYKSVAQRTPEAFVAWLDQAHTQRGLLDVVLVGAPASSSQVQLSLRDACRLLAEHEAPFHLGGVTIAERHATKKDEHQRLLAKTERGCEFFISQAIYDAQATIDLLTRYAHACRAAGQRPRRVILTFSPCGSAKTLEFIRWLGISVPEATELRITHAEHPLRESVAICQANLDQILSNCADLGVPLGLNIESLTNRKAEIDAAILLFRMLRGTMERALARVALSAL